MSMTPPSELTQRTNWPVFIVRAYLCAMAFLLPFMFGCQIMATEEANLPTDVLVWLILGFTPSAPAFLAPLFAGIGLLLALCVYHRPWLRQRHCGWQLLWLAPILAGLIGLSTTTECDYAHNWLLHFTGVLTYGLAVWWASENDCKLLPSLALSIGLGTMILCCHGAYQRLGGFQAQLEEMQRQHLELYGQPLSEQITQKMQQMRVYSFFSDPNLFAAHLIVCIPLTIWGLFHWLKGRQLVVCSALVVLVATIVFLWTGSRGGFIGLLCGLALGVWSLQWLQSRRWKWLLPLGTALLVIGVVLMASMNKERGGVETASVRMNYYRAAIQMFTSKPMTGVGLGEFFTWFVRTKSPEAELARDPHSFFLSCLSQSGLFGGIAVLLVLCYPFVAAIRRTRLKSTAVVPPDWHDDLCRALPIVAFGGWAVHSFFQFNELIPGTVYFLSWLPLLAMYHTDTAATSPRKPVSILRFAAILPLMACILGVGRKLPGEARLQAASERGNQLLRLGADIKQGRAKHQDVTAMEQYYDNAKRQHEQELLSLCQDIPLAPAPCNLMLNLLEADLPAMHTLPAERQKLILDVSHMNVARTPHRAVPLNRHARICMAAGKWEEAAETLQQSLMWFPGNGENAMLSVICDQRNTSAVPLAKLDVKVAAEEHAWRADVYTPDTPSSSALRDLLEERSVTLPNGQILYFVVK